MLSSSNITGMVNSLKYKNGMTSTQGDDHIQIGRLSTDLILEQNLTNKGPITGMSSLNISGNTTLEGPITGMSSLNISGVTTLNTLNAYEVKQQYQSAPNQFALLVPTGTIVTYAGTIAPAGWFICDGSAKSKTVYTNLFNVVGTIYGESGSNFLLPNLKGKVPVGLDNSQSEFNTIGQLGGEKTHTLTVDEIPPHTHTYQNNVGDQNTDNAFSTETAADNVDYNQNTGSTGGGQPHNNLQPYIVKYIWQRTS
jgi:microcystin-dependent protein